MGEQRESHTDRQGNNLSQVHLGWSVIYSGQGHVIYRWVGILDYSVQHRSYSQYGEQNNITDARDYIIETNCILLH